MPVPQYLRPGVYFEEVWHSRLSSNTWAVPRVGGAPPDEVARAPKPTWTAEHSVAAFVGFAARGPVDTPTLLTEWPQFELTFGDFLPDWYLAHAVYGFFLNGGRTCYVVRVGEGAPDPSRVAPERLGPDHFIGDTANRTGLRSLEALDDISIVCVPDLMAAYERGVFDLYGVEAVQTSMIAHCESTGERIAILDSPPGLSAQQVHEWRTESVRYDTRFAALYYPWLRVFDPVQGMSRFVPPCGHVAGVYARTDLVRGPHRSPANEVVKGAFGLESSLLLQEMDALNPRGINALVTAPGSGIRVWGSRTLSSDPDQRYVRRTRLMRFIRRNLRRGTEWTIFQPSEDRRVWARVVRDIEDLLLLLWRSGALVGAAPEEAFSVRCDEETNLPEQNQIVAECVVAPEAGSTIAFRVVYFCD